MSREGAPAERERASERAAARASGTPIWVWIVYALGIFAGVIFAFSVLFTLGAFLLSDDIPLSYDVSIPAIVLWGGMLLVAIALWVVRRRRR